MRNMASKKPVSEKESFFIRMMHPVGLRRQVLQCSKIDLGSLKSYERLIEIRSKKLVEISNLKKDIKEIKLLIQNLNGIFSKHRIERFVKPAKPLAAKPAQPDPKKAVHHPVRASELEKLESTLNQIEKKLQQLS